MRPVWLLGFVIASMSLLFAGGYWVGYRVTLTQIAERGEAALTLVSERLTLQLERYRYLPSVLAGDPAVQSILQDPGSIAPGNSFLQRIADTSGASDIYVMDRTGLTIAASNWNLDRSFVGQNYAWRPYFQRAMDGGLGYYHAVGRVSDQRGFYFAHPILGPDRQIAGVITVKVDLDRIEGQWRGDQPNLFFSDQNGVIFLSNRPSLVLRKMNEVPIADPARYSNRVIAPLPEFTKAQSAGFELWRGLQLQDFPFEGLFLTSPVPTLDMNAHILINTDAAPTQALILGGLASALGGLIWAIAGFAMQRRAAYATQLKIEERARNQLEDKVEERTAALNQVQAQLVQAGKLTALGEMSAGISHELNQPLAAIQSLADNADILLDRGDIGQVQGNVSKISKLAERMGRIIRNLRSFARNEAEEISDVDLCEVLQDALGIVHGKLDATGTKVTVRGDTRPVIVRGGKVRLQQVIVNLLSNAVDAMDGQHDKRIDLSLQERGGQVRLTVRDYGPGLANPKRIFDPFYTTKTVGEGLGLGLSISYGIVQSFGGQIHGDNHPDGGALFTIDLSRPEEGGPLS